jgi:hypothetical protein
MSADDKRSTILKLYHTAMEPYNLKEIEQLASRSGVVQQTVKDMNQSLVDDSLVFSDKIGSANFFWSFPSKGYHDKKNKKDELEGLVARSTAAAAELTKQLEEARVSRQAPGRKAMLTELAELEAREKQLDTTLEKSKAHDPEELKRLNKEVMDMLQHVNRWTDNVYAVKKFYTKKRGMGGKEADKFLGISDDFSDLTPDDLKQFIKERDAKAAKAAKAQMAKNAKRL